MIPAQSWRVPNHEHPLTIYLRNYRLCGEHFSLTGQPGKECYVGVTCERCSQTMVYSKSEARVAQSSWSAL